MRTVTVTTFSPFDDHTIICLDDSHNLTIVQQTQNNVKICRRCFEKIIKDIEELKAEVKELKSVEANRIDALRRI